CHLQLADRDPEPLLQRAEDAGVGWVVSPGTDLDSSRRSLELAARFPGRVLPTAGVHPHDAKRWAEERDGIAEMAATAAAVGETGLDFYRNLSRPDEQVAAFADQLRLAGELDKPVIVHCRDAFSEVYRLLEEWGSAGRAVLHCWTGGPRWTRRFVDLGVSFSYAGPLCFPTGDTVRRGAAQAPPERTMVETDTPYLSPPPHRDEPNEPARVVLVGAALAEVWGVPAEEVARLTTARAEQVFAVA
ncbi:MAG: TatD family hydrolase, partial [Actinomycetota bacterium]|nr:TatD family hydrolase [Actinomycetota bacterium]